MSNNLTRKVRRQKSNQIKKDLGKQIKRQVALFKRLPDTCSSCASKFDKKSKEQHATWEVKVRSGEGYEMVDLLCPECLEKNK